MSHLRAAIVPFSMLILASLACTSVTRILQPEPAWRRAWRRAYDHTAGGRSRTNPGPPLAEIPTPTPFHVEDEGDIRGVLDLSKPDHVDYFDNPRPGSTMTLLGGHLSCGGRASLWQRL